MTNDYLYHPPLELGALLAEPLTPFKGLPESLVGKPLRVLGAARSNALDSRAFFPMGLLKLSAIEHNSQWMRRFLALTGALIAPHGKTTMAPQLLDRQLKDGAWGITAATMAHVRNYRRHGVQRILLANQLVAGGEIDYIVEEMREDPELDFYCLVDSLDGLAILTARLARLSPSRPLQVLLEVGARDARTGVRELGDGVTLGRALRDAGPAICLRGIEAFEGVFSGTDMPRMERGVEDMLDKVVALTQTGVAEGWFGPEPILLSAGGSAFFDMAGARLSGAQIDRKTLIVLRSGCYLTHDSRHYEQLAVRMRARSAGVAALGPGLRSALEIVALVQSMPEEGRVIATFGKRDASFDIHLPEAIWWFRPGIHEQPQPLAGQVTVTGLNDQHAFLSTSPEMAFKVGDIMGFGISHPCTTFDKWPLLLVVDDDYVIVSAVRTYF